MARVWQKVLHYARNLCLRVHKILEINFNKFILSFKDDDLLVHINEVSLFELYCQLQQNPVPAGLVIATVKIIRQTSFEYLGYMLYAKEIKTQKLEIKRE